CRRADKVGIGATPAEWQAGPSLCAPVGAVASRVPGGPMTLPDPRVDPVLTVVEAGALLKLSRSASYRAAHRGDLPTIHLGSRLLVPTAALWRLLGYEPPSGPST